MDKFRIDSTKIHFHPSHVAQVMEADTWEKAKKVYPIYWEITTSAACNHRCSFCSVDAIGYPAILMNHRVLCDRMFEAHQLGVKSVMFGGTGEPLLHKSINPIVRSASRSGLDTAFTTNGVLLNKLELELCSWVKVSLNAGTRESYAAIHKTDEKDWDTVWRNIKDATQRKGSCAVGVQCVVLPENYREMDALARLSLDAGADYLVLKPYSQATFSIVQREVDYRPMRDYLNGVASAHTGPGFEVVVRTNAITNEITGKHNFDKCRATPFTWVYSMANGDVFTCSAHLLDHKFCIGNLNTQSFQEIWEGDKRRENWEMMKEFDIHNCRLSCRMAQANTYLEQLAHGVAHQNFV